MSLENTSGDLAAVTMAHWRKIATRSLFQREALHTAKSQN